MFLRRLLLPVSPFSSFFLPILATWLALGCSKNEDYCPGLCSDETGMPSMTISSADGAASIASAKVVSGPCTAMVLHSEGEVGVPTSYAQVQVIYSWPTDVPPLCIVEVTSRFGQIESVALQVKSRAYTPVCCPYGTCCPKTEDALAQRYHMEFDPKTQTVSFPPPPDGGADHDAADAMDAPSRDDAQELDASSIDAGVIDGSARDAGTADADDLDTAVVDVADGVDLPTDT